MYVSFIGLRLTKTNLSEAKALSNEQAQVFLNETDIERILDSDESVCCSVLQRQLQILVPRKKVSGRSW